MNRFIYIMMAALLPITGCTPAKKIEENAKAAQGWCNYYGRDDCPDDEKDESDWWDDFYGR